MVIRDWQSLSKQWITVVLSCLKRIETEFLYNHILSAWAGIKTVPSKDDVEISTRLGPKLSDIKLSLIIRKDRLQW